MGRLHPIRLSGGGGGVQNVPKGLQSFFSRSAGAPAIRLENHAISGSFQKLSEFCRLKHLSQTTEKNYARRGALRPVGFWDRGLGAVVSIRARRLVSRLTGFVCLPAALRGKKSAAPRHRLVAGGPLFPPEQFRE